jgi:hypothetical protein
MHDEHTKFHWDKKEAMRKLSNSQNWMKKGKFCSVTVRQYLANGTTAKIWIINDLS